MAVVSLAWARWLWVERAGLVVGGIARADGENLFDGSFADENVGVVAALEHDRHPAPLKVEWNLVDLAEPFIDLQFLLQFDMFEHRDIEQILEAGLVEAVQVGIFENAVGIVALQIEVALEDDQVLRQRTGLVGAQHVHRPEVLDGVEAFDDDLFLRHRHCALGQIDGHDHRQHFRREPDRNGDREQQRLEPIALAQAVDQEHQRGHDRNEADHHPGDPGDALVEAGQHALLGDRASHLTESGACDRLARRHRSRRR